MIGVKVAVESLLEHIVSGFCWRDEDFRPCRKALEIGTSL